MKLAALVAVALAQAVQVDAVAVRFSAAETGGPQRPRFITQRELAFEARLLACAEEGRLAAPQDRHVRAAVEQHVAIEMLSRMPLDPEPDARALDRIARVLRAATIDRVGGEEALAAAAAAEGLGAWEVDAALAREARAAAYVDRRIVPILSPKEDALREAYRTTAHPYRRSKYEDARDPFTRWFVYERLRAEETQYLENARARVHVAYSGR